MLKLPHVIAFFVLVLTPCLPAQGFVRPGPSSNSNLASGPAFGQQNAITTNANGAQFVFAIDLDGDGDADLLAASHDGDTLPDGLELGFTSGTLETDGNVFVPDADPLTTTNPLEADSDSGGVDDGIEDQTGDGAINTWETDPNQAADDDFAFYVTNLTPGGIIHFKVYNATPNMVIVPAFSLTGAGPTMTTLGINVALSMPITVLPPTLSDNQGAASWNGPRVPNGAQLGFGVYIQAVEVPVSSQQQPRTSNAVLLPVGTN